MKGRYAVLIALVAGTGLRIGEALAVRLRTLIRIAMCYTYGEASGTDASKHQKLRTRFDSSISRRCWHNFYADTRKE
jgi:integrase